MHHRNNLQIKSFGGQVGFCCSCSAVLRAACRKCLSPKLLRQGRSQVVAPYPGVINIREALMDGLSGCAQTVPMSTCNLQGLFARRLSTCTTYPLQWRLGNTYSRARVRFEFGKVFRISNIRLKKIVEFRM